MPLSPAQLRPQGLPLNSITDRLLPVLAIAALTVCWVLILALPKLHTARDASTVSASSSAPLAWRNAPDNQSPTGAKFDASETGTTGVLHTLEVGERSYDPVNEPVLQEQLSQLLAAEELTTEQRAEVETLIAVLQDRKRRRDLAP